MLRALVVVLLLALASCAMAREHYQIENLHEVASLRATKAAQGLRLVAIQDMDPSGKVTARWMTEGQVASLAAPGRKTHFVDLTDFDFDLAAEPVPAQLKGESVDAAIPQNPRHLSLVRDIISNQLCRPRCQEEILRVDTQLSSYHTRYYTQQTALEAALWLKGQYELAAGNRLGQDITVELFEHRWLQPSIIIKMRGTTHPDEVVVIGGHIDSTVGNPTARSPGSDDDASGSSTVFAAFRALVNAGYRPHRTVEFHAYAAEEAGLLGSQDVARAWKSRGVNVVSMCQFDMTGYSTQRTVGLIRDNTNNALTDLIAKLLTTYTDIKGQDSRCGYGCSDHASWNAQGYPAAFPFEAPFGSHSPYIHTVNDVLANMDHDYMGQFGKLAVAYVVELSRL